MSGTNHLIAALGIGATARAGRLFARLSGARRAVQLFPDAGQLGRAAARTLARAGETRDAVGLLEELERRGQATRAERLERVRLLLDLDEVAAANALLETFLGEHRRDRDALLLRARGARLEEDWAGVQRAAGAVIAQDDQDADAMVEMARAERHLTGLRGARTWLRHALRVAPEHPAARRELGSLYREKGHTKW